MLRMGMIFSIPLMFWYVIERFIFSITGWGETVFFLYFGLLFLVATVMALKDNPTREVKIQSAVVMLLLVVPGLFLGIRNLLNG